ncbi:dimethyladenosine transferase [Streptococcus periodonticum]|uniref:Dimethyladenosine transferase n=1 Tax=Streptococcus periodonticum TaxID=2490633 RepID=A0A3Q9F4E6_9STRE|nr:dimethyladenosine transferase [Streptococcus periodonticum]AZQ42408.1 dimethyladenosine transferase [Streptococcus periodonticum]
MANRSYIYFKNGDEVRVLAEGIYTIPYFWQLFWGEEELQAAIDLWQKAEELEKEDKEKTEEFYRTQDTGIALSDENFHQNARRNRSFLEQHAPQTLQLYDDFVCYITANIKEGDTLGFDVLEIISMDELPIASDKLLKNVRAIQQNRPEDLDFSLANEDLLGIAMGFPDDYASDMLPVDNILNSVAYQDELKKRQNQESKQADNVIESDSKGNKRRIHPAFWILLVLGIMRILYILFS